MRSRTRRGITMSANTANMTDPEVLLPAGFSPSGAATAPSPESSCGPKPGRRRERPRLVADACNHRIQEFDSQGRFLQMWGTQGGAWRESCTILMIWSSIVPEPCLWRNSAIIASSGSPAMAAFGVWGVQGRGEGQLQQPLALVQDHQGRIHVLDTNNHRVQVIRPHAANR